MTKTRKGLIAAVATVLLSAVVGVGALNYSSPKEKVAQSVAVEALATSTLPPENDIFLSPSTSYGSYFMNKSGTPDNPIVVWGNGATLQCVHITGDWVVWRDTTVTNCTTFGIRVNGNNVEVLNNHIYDTVRMNLLSTGRCNDSPTASWHSGIRVADNTGVIVAHNKVHNSCGEGIGFLRTSNGVIEYNEVWDVFSVNIYCDQCGNVRISNNYSYSTGDTSYYKVGKVARGISIGAESYSGWAFNVHDLLIENNLLERVRGINYIQEQAGTPTNIVVRNNVFVNVVEPLLSLGAWATVTNNVTATPGGSTPVPATATRTPTQVVVSSPTPTATRTSTPVPPTATRTPTSSPTVAPATSTPIPVATANCVPALTVWVCDKQPIQR